MVILFYCCFIIFFIFVYLTIFDKINLIQFSIFFVIEIHCINNILLYILLYI